MASISDRDNREIEAANASGAPPVVLRLEDCISETTADRWYKVLLDHHVGRSQVTQFVGAIPPGRAPDHYHEYEEVLCILQGRVENTGDSELRLLGVFHPSGSPAVRYYDG